MMVSYGTAGGSLSGNNSTSRSGKIGEIRTANLLSRACPQATILHDLSIDGARANIDHAIIAGGEVVLVDSKRWRAGTYYSIGSKTLRWPLHKAHTGGKTMQWAIDQLARESIRATGVFVIHGDVKLVGCHPSGFLAMTPDQLAAWVASRLNYSADPRIVARLGRRVR